MRITTLGLAALGAVVMQPAMAGTFALGLDATGRLYDRQSQVYAEIDSNWGLITNPNSANVGLAADGYFCSSVGGSCLSVGQKIGSGVIAFPSGGNFGSVGSLTYDDASGAITGLALNFAPYLSIEGSAPVGWSFTTQVSNVSGTVDLVNGAVSGINLSSNLTFLVLGAVPYTGTFVANGNSFALDVEGTYTNALGTLSLRWDLDGDVNGLAAPVPEPSTYALMALGALVVGGLARRRSQPR